MATNTYYDRYASDADPVSILSAGRHRIESKSKLAERIAALNPNEDASHAADVVYDTALIEVARRIYDAVADDLGLRPDAQTFGEIEDWLAEGGFDGDETIGDLAEEFVEYWDQQQ